MIGDVRDNHDTRTGLSTVILLQSTATHPLASSENRQHDVALGSNSVVCANKIPASLMSEAQAGPRAMEEMIGILRGKMLLQPGGMTINDNNALENVRVCAH